MLKLLLALCERQVAARPLQDAARQVGRSPEPAGQRVRVVDGHQQPVDLVHQLEEHLAAVKLAAPQLVQHEAAKLAGCLGEAVQERRDSDSDLLGGWHRGAADQAERGRRLDVLLLRVLDVPGVEQVGVRREVLGQAFGERFGGSEELLGLLVVAAVDGSDRVGAGPRQLTRLREGLLAGGVPGFELGPGPALDLVEHRHDSTTISIRLLIRPLFSFLVILTRPTSRVLATWVPPSACWSIPSMLMTRISWMAAGRRLMLVRIRSGIWNACSRGRIETYTG